MVQTSNYKLQHMNCCMAETVLIWLEGLLET